ncbi:hypothetical protein M404DRAFT_29865 [Pisolithus tinctorius Marx 270]|uniref:Uncharacterized protein n=1 Tax=Pisolithus tinctorius Marx 270 TaxID=870435 RepID=A0A0C3JRD5_PISTI|nr:hypothetical protein M404DRAFT_29865 [Pisolithus tinctorius Marx 270]
MVDNVILIDLEGLIADWDMYPFSLNIPSAGTKRIVLHVKHPEFHKHSCPQVKEPYTQPVQVKNITLKYTDPVKVEDASQVLGDSKLEESGESEDLTNCENSL